MESKTFSLGQILSITHGRMLVKDFGDVYEILDFMSGDNNFRHQLPRVADECKPYLMEAFSGWIESAHADVDAFFALWSGDQAVLWRWMDKIMKPKYGATHEVYPIHFEDHRVVDPVTELLEMKPDAQVITLTDEDTQSPSPYGDINWKVDGDDE